MCGRFALESRPEKIKAQFSAEGLPDLVPRYNIAPSQDVLFLMQSSDASIHGELFTWGLIPFFSKEKKVIPPLYNARAETIATKPSFRDALKSRRGIVIMSGFFEWRQVNGIKQPYYISKKNKELLAIAALWETWCSPEGEVIHSCCLITTEANEVMQPLHNRMPVILNPKQQHIWMDNSHFDRDFLLSVLLPYSEDDLQIYPVTPKMNNWRFTDREAIKPLK